MTSDIHSIPGFHEPFSSLSHLGGAAVFAILAVRLLRRGRGDGWREVYLGIFAFSCVFLMAMSGVYHLLDRGGAGRTVMARLDHAAIFVLIAGTFTPVHGIVFHGAQRWGPLLLLWALAAIAISLKSIYFGELGEGLGLALYLGMGWIGLVSGSILWRRHGWRFVLPLAWGGVAYTAGAILEFLRWPVLIPGVLGPHELFHVAVLLGAGLHWRFVSSFASGALPLR